MVGNYEKQQRKFIKTGNQEKENISILFEEKKKQNINEQARSYKDLSIKV